MSRQAGIKEFFPTDKAIDSDSDSALATPPIPDLPSIPPDPPSGPAAPYGLVTPSASVTPPATNDASLKRGALQAPDSERGHKRARMSASSGDNTASIVPTDEDVDFEPEFPDGPLTVWAMTRGDLCDSQHTFQAYQGGTYTRNNQAISVFVDKYTEPRDTLCRNKLITCA